MEFYPNILIKYQFDFIHFLKPDSQKFNFIIPPFAFLTFFAMQIR